MIVFWIAAAALSAAVAGLMLARGARAAVAQGEDPALAVHRRQLSEIDELAQRGLLADDERRAARAEAGRRLLAAAEQEPARASGGGRRGALVAAAVTPLAALALYFYVGSPDAPDQPFSGRLAEWRQADPSTLEPPQMAAVLQMIAAERPGDPEPLRNLALARLAYGDTAGAVDALRRAVAAAPERADLWGALGEAFVLEGEGEIGADAQRAFAEALTRDPRTETPRYYLARAKIAGGDVAGGVAEWRALLADLDPQDPRRQALGAEISAVESAGGLPAPRPTGQVDAEAIEGMVEGLAARLEENPDDPDGWVRLVRAYAVMGDTDKRDAALARARTMYGARPDVLDALEKAAEAPQ